ncbi:ECF RNA polymerase sigma factor SigK [Microbacterium azadirachtae]|uniref:ECF RNA polymerase sigma factor SigK n=1 Tax=Microbacterium azadirachtae TaxID=582680 RepID=A0A0F0L512_9MICO|nr:ECF RNA polymerase sigma factor SigK [Microbacterium azadirachtae]
MNGLYEAELNHARPAWPSVTEVEFQTMNWVNRWNSTRLHEALDYATPAEAEAAYYQSRSATPALTWRPAQNPGRFSRTTLASRFALFLELFRRDGAIRVVISDSDIVLASQRVPGRFSEIFERHAPRVEAFIISRVGTTAKDDILSETFLAAFRYRDKFDLAAESALPWLMGIATRMIRRHRSDEAKHWRSLTASAGLAAEIAPDDLAAAAIRVDAQAAVRELAPRISALRDRDRDLLLLYAWGDLTYEQIAEALAIPIGTVRSRLSRIRANLSAPPIFGAAALPSSDIKGEPAWTL